MPRRDEAIQLAGAKYAEKKRELADLKDALDGQAQFLDNEQANNREVEGKIQVCPAQKGGQAPDRKIEVEGACARVFTRQQFCKEYGWIALTR